MIKTIFSLLVYAASVYVSWKNCGAYWIVGPVFAGALLLVNLDAVRKNFSVKHIALAAASTLIYALVFLIANKGWRLSPEWLDMLAGSASAGVLVGSILMPVVHAAIFGLNLETAKATTFALIISWYVVTAISLLREYMGLNLPVEEGLLAVALWQGIYLLKLKLR